ncbi:MAG: flagellar basal body rod protein FlgB [Stellaceae bacterium]
MEDGLVAGVLDTGLDFYRQVLAVRGYRQEVLAADIANASTPGFKAVDVDFAAALKQAGADDSSGAPARLWLVDDPRQMQPSGAAAGDSPAAEAVKYQAGTEVTLDGNSVDLDQEKTAAAANGVDYEAVATFTTQTLRMLATAVNGSPGQASGA